MMRSAETCEDASDSQILKELNACRDDGGRGLWRVLGGNHGDEIRIEHKSLILAQDERWRRA